MSVSTQMVTCDNAACQRTISMTDFERIDKWWTVKQPSALDRLWFCSRRCLEWWLLPMPVDGPPKPFPEDAPVRRRRWWRRA